MKKLMKKCMAITLSALLCLMALPVAFAADADAAPATMPEVNLNQYGLAEKVNEGSILHCWCWSFNTIKEMIPQIAAAGFSSIQTSPINSILEGDNGGLQINGSGKWYYHYQPTEYETIGNYQLGTDEEFREMCAVAHEYGVKVIVDQVLNHLTSNSSAISKNITNNIADPFHTDKGNWSETDRYEETQRSLSGLIEWNTQNPEVQDYLHRWLEICVEAGADGFRFDAAKLIELPDDTSEKYGNDFASDFWPVILQNGASFQYGESLQEGGIHVYSRDLKGGYDDNDSSRLYAYQSQTFTDKNGETQNMNTTLSLYGFRLRDAVSHGNVSVDFVEDMLVPSKATAERTVTWVESHDNYCNDASYTELDEQQVIQAWAILSARKDGTPLFFSRPNNSSASKPWGDNKIGPAGSSMYMDSQVVAVNLFRNEMGNSPEYLSNPTGSDKVIMIERGDAGAVIVNLSDEDLVLDGAPVQSMADGSYTDQAFGSEFTVAEGKISGTVKSGKVAVVYNSQVDSGLEFEPAVSVSVPTSDFLTDTLKVSVSIRGCASAVYQINGGEEIAVANGDDIIIGADMAANESAKLTVTGYDAEGNAVAKAEATYTKKTYRGDTVVYMESAAHSNWSKVNVYVWASVGGSTVQNAGWPGVPAERLEDGTWKYVLPYELENVNANIIFNNGSQQHDMPTPIKPGTSMILTANGQWILYGQAETPEVALSPGSSVFEDTLDITLKVVACESASYQLGDNEPVPCKNGDVITIGEDMEDGDSIKLTLTGVDASGKKYTATAEYLKKIYVGNSVVYIDPQRHTNWNNFYVYVYTTSGDLQTNGSWPGAKMTLDEATGLYYYVLPDNVQKRDVNIIFNNGSGTQDNDYSMKPDTQMICNADGSWTAYEPPVEPDPEYVIGDADGDGKVDVADATLIQMHIAELDTIEGDRYYIADVNNDGVLNIADATLIQMYIAEMITEFDRTSV